MTCEQCTEDNTTIIYKDMSWFDKRILFKNFPFRVCHSCQASIIEKSTLIRAEELTEQFKKNDMTFLYRIGLKTKEIEFR